MKVGKRLALFFILITPTAGAKTLTQVINAETKAQTILQRIENALENLESMADSKQKTWALNTVKTRATVFFERSKDIVKKTEAILESANTALQKSREERDHLKKEEPSATNKEQVLRAYIPILEQQERDRNNAIKAQTAALNIEQQASALLNRANSLACQAVISDPV